MNLNTIWSKLASRLIGPLVVATIAFKHQYFSMKAIKTCHHVAHLKKSVDIQNENNVVNMSILGYLG